MTIDEDKRFRTLLALIDAYNIQVRNLGSDSGQCPNSVLRNSILDPGEPIFWAGVSW